MEKDLKMAPPEEPLREEGVLHLKESSDEGVERLSCGAGGSTLGLSQEIKRFGWIRKRKTGRPCYRKWRPWAPVRAIANWEFCWVEPLGPLPSLRTPGNQNLKR